MLVDLSKAKAGDTVKFRCGGTAVISKYRYIHNAERSMCRIEFEGYGYGSSYFVDGRLYISEEHPLDITEVILAPVPFDWKDARWGMAFVTRSDAMFWFIGTSPIKGITKRWFEDVDGDLYGEYNTTQFTRAPEHDVEGV